MGAATATPFVAKCQSVITVKLTRPRVPSAAASAAVAAAVVR